MSEEIFDEDYFHNVYRLFHYNLRILADKSALRCNLQMSEMRSELVQDGFNCLHFSKCFEAEQRLLIKELLVDLEAIPKSSFSGNKTPEGKFLDMNHPCWVPLREKAARILKAIEPITKRNVDYFRAD